VGDVGSSNEGEGEIADDGVDGRVRWGGEFEGEGEEELMVKEERRKVIVRTAGENDATRGGNEPVETRWGV